MNRKMRRALERQALHEAKRYVQMGEWKCPEDGETLPMYMDERILRHLRECAPREVHQAEVVDHGIQGPDASEDEVPPVRGDGGDPEDG